MDAIEIFNARSFTKASSAQAKEYARENNLRGTVGSDAHSLVEVGRATQLVHPFFDAESMRQSFLNPEYVKYTSSPLVRFTSTNARMLKRIFGKNRFPI